MNIGLLNPGAMGVSVGASVGVSVTGASVAVGVAVTATSVGVAGSVGLGLLIAGLVDRVKYESVAKTFIFLPLAISLVGAPP